jgi:hypothetical protein
MPIARVPAEFDSATVQLLMEPTGILAGAQVSDNSLGVGHNSNGAFCEDMPRVALTMDCALDTTVPAVAMKLPVAFPAETMRVAGVESRAELEFTDTVVSDETARDRVITHVTQAPDITPVALQATLETSTGATRLMEVDWELVPRVEEIVAV